METQTPNEIYVDTKKAEKVLMLSFMLSQGDASLQVSLFEWLSLRGYLDFKQMSATIPISLKERSVPARHTALSGSNEAQEEYSKIWSYLYGSVNGKEVRNSEQYVFERITELMVIRDLKYQKSGRPSAKPTKGSAPDSTHDANASFLRRFAINGDPVHFEGFDELNGEIADLLRSYDRNELKLLEKSNIEHLDMKIQALLSKFEPRRSNALVNNELFSHRLMLLVKLWEKNHPGLTFFKKDNNML